MRWPTMMKRKTCAEYLDMSERAFLRAVSEGRFPPSVMVGRGEYWYRDAIDKAVAAQFGTTDDLEPWERKLFSGKAA